MDDAPAPRASLRDQFRWFGVALAAVAVVGLASGWLFAKGQPSTAAWTLIEKFVDEEPPGAFDPADPAPTDAIAPSWGPHADGEVRCGVVVDLSVADHLASLAAGVVVIRYRDDLETGAVREIETLAEDRRELLVAVAPGLDRAIEAVAWGRRLRFSAHNLEWIKTFHTANVDRLVPDDVPLPATCNGA